MKIITTLTLLATLASPAIAQQKADDHSAHHPEVAASAADMTDGEVRKVDKNAKKLTIKHGEIKNLGMPAMTMVYQVKDAALLERVKAGDKVRFRAVNEAGKYVVTDLQDTP